MSSRSKLSVVVALCLALLISATEGNAQETSQQRTVKSFTTLDKESSNQCPSGEEWERGAKETKEQVRSLLTEYLSDMQSQTTTSSASISTVTQSPTEADSTQSTESPTTAQTTEQSMSTTTKPLYTCNGTPGWRQVVFINMTDTSYDCPPGLKLTSYSKRTCGQAHTNREDCSSTTFSVGGSEYSRVCGRIRGYQVGGSSAFSASSQSIESWYVDGVSLTHGPAGRRQHIWSFAIGLTEVNNDQSVDSLCPCDTSNADIVSPSFVGNDYFCESGLHSGWNCNPYCGEPFLDDPLWDGQNCTSTSTCCQLNNPPWFTKNLPNLTTDDIELRICLRAEIRIGDSPLEIIELYVK